MNTKKITYYTALVFIISILTYGSILAGTLAHELTHLSNAHQPVALLVNFDGSGSTIANSFSADDTERYAYFIGSIIEITLLLIGLLSIAIIMGRKDG
jgi:hypothetical protein